MEGTPRTRQSEGTSRSAPGTPETECLPLAASRAPRTLSESLDGLHEIPICLGHPHRPVERIEKGKLRIALLGLWSQLRQKVQEVHRAVTILVLHSPASEPLDLVSFPFGVENSASMMIHESGLEGVSQLLLFIIGTINQRTTAISGELGNTVDDFGC